jgi:hypothetical protein
MTYYPGNPRWSAPGLMNSRLHGTGRIADDLYLIAHHETTGKPYLSRRAVGIGIAGGLLAELLSAPRPAVTVEHGRMFPLYRRNGEPVALYAHPDEAVTRRVLDVIVAESQPRPTRDWLLFLGKTSAASVAGRLEQAGYLYRPTSRLPWRTPSPVPVEGDSSQCALLRAATPLDQSRGTPAHYTWLLNRLTMACGLRFRLSNLPSGPASAVVEAPETLSRPLRELIAHVQAAADSAVLSTIM